MDCRRHALQPELTYGNLYDIGAACGDGDRLLVLLVSDVLARSDAAAAAHQLERLGEATARRFRDSLRHRFQFAWLDGNEIANNIVLGCALLPAGGREWNEKGAGTMAIPSLLVLNASSQEYCLPSDAVQSMTPESLHLWLLSVADGHVPVPLPFPLSSTGR